MQPCVVLDRRSPRQAIADEAYCRLRALLIDEPGQFLAVREGLAILADALDEHVLRFAHDDALPRATVIAGATADCWLLRATHRYWLLHPEAFDCTEELPTGVQDYRWDKITALVGVTSRSSATGHVDEQRPGARAVETRHSRRLGQPVFDDGWQ